MQRYANRYLEAEPPNGFIADPRRVLAGTLAAPLVPSIGAAILNMQIFEFWPVAILGLLSVITLYLPLVLWSLPRTQHPFIACVLLGGISAPGLIGYGLSIMAGFAIGAPAAPIIIMMLTFPLGAVGGATFWLCTVWCSEGWGEE
jgi:hypothetical protein